MKRNQSGFTLIEIAIVLVIIGLLLGGVLKGQELINSAKVKNLAGDFKSTTLFIYNYQDKFKALPGDDTLAANHVTGAIVATTPVAANVGNGRIDGKWDSITATDETFLFWQHVRLSGIAAGGTDTANLAEYKPRNTTGGPLGITNSTAADLPITALKGTYIICSANIIGKFAKQLDIALDDGNTASGSVRVILDQVAFTVGVAASATADVDDTLLYTVCQGV